MSPWIIVLELGTSELGTSELGTSELGTSELGTFSVLSPEPADSKVDKLEFGTLGLGTVVLS